jgi:hypothetical protein
MWEFSADRVCGVSSAILGLSQAIARSGWWVNSVHGIPGVIVLWGGASGEGARAPSLSLPHDTIGWVLPDTLCGGDRPICPPHDTIGWIIFTDTDTIGWVVPEPKGSELDSLCLPHDTIGWILTNTASHRGASLSLSTMVRGGGHRKYISRHYRAPVHRESRRAPVPPDTEKNKNKVFELFLHIRYVKCNLEGSSIFYGKNPQGTGY